MPTAMPSIDAGPITFTAGKISVGGTSCFSGTSDGTDDTVAAKSQPTARNRSLEGDISRRPARGRVRDTSVRDDVLCRLLG